MTKQRIESGSENSKGKRNQRDFQTIPPVRASKRLNPVPSPQKPETLHRVDSQKKQCKEENSAKNQGNTPLGNSCN
jgi:hypothetical protein